MNTELSQFIDNILHSGQPIKLHLGCGTVYKEGWINIDNNSDNNIEKLDLNWDLCKPLPFPNESVDFIYNEHFFEHLSPEEAHSVLVDFMRVLKPDGVMRIAMPDLRRLVNIYLDKARRKPNRDNLDKYGLTHVKTRAENLNIDFRAWGHKWLYDYEELERRLKETGCSWVKECRIFESDFEELRNLETRNESPLVAEVMKIIPDETSAEMPLVTIACITYNQEKFIRDALESFVTQKAKFHFEVIIADDCSADSTPDIIREYEQKYPDIFKPIYRKENIGAIENFVDTLSCAHSKYVIINEGDDYFTDPQKLQKQVDFLETHPECSICFHPVQVIYEDEPSKIEIFPVPNQRFDKTYLTLDDLLKHNFIQTNSCMYHWRFTDEDISNVFPKDILPGDWYLHLLHAQIGNIGFLDEVMSVYRKHSGGIWYDSYKDLEGLFLKNGSKMLAFYDNVCKNIAPNPNDYINNRLLPSFEHIVNIHINHKRKAGIVLIFNQYPDYFLELIKHLKNQTEEQRQRIDGITHSVSYRVSKKLKGNTLFALCYRLLKKCYKFVKRVL
ncbi:hypothetical protein FACS189494_06150 [Spirochaetia bacterium]|nr:hypothetical protein FACS189494_06150 [Spirochaetia bacterium]